MMDKQNWTPEPWGSGKHENYPRLEHHYNDDQWERVQANKKRAFACVNALAGIRNPEAVRELVKATYNLSRYLPMRVVRQSPDESTEWYCTLCQAKAKQFGDV